MTKITIMPGDITRIHCDAIVNAANNSLLGGGGVDGAIHHAGGPAILEECVKLNGCETGRAKITGAGNLKCQYVIHTVGPVWHGGHLGEPEYLKSCYINSLSLAVEYGLKSLAFPNISTGVYDYPKQKAAEIAIRAVYEFLDYNIDMKEIIFCCYDEENYQIYKTLMSGTAI